MSESATLEGAQDVQAVRVGRWLSWEDMANPKRFGVVVEINSRVMEVNFRLGRLLPVRQEITVVFDDWAIHRVPQTIVDGNAWRWEERPDLDAERCAATLKTAEERRTQDLKTSELRHKEHAEKTRAFEAELLAMKPAWAKAILVAIQDIDDCDYQTDYHNHKEGRRVALAWSKHTRDLFPEMRKAAGKLEETRHLVAASKEAEHREKYSMGEGYYLKNGYGHGGGWRVEKVDLGSEYSRRYLYGADMGLVKAKPWAHAKT